VERADRTVAVEGSYHRIFRSAFGAKTTTKTSPDVDLYESLAQHDMVIDHTWPTWEIMNLCSWYSNFVRIRCKSTSCLEADE
jgi:hypothetical protein